MKRLFTLFVGFLSIILTANVYAGNLIAQNATLNLSGPDTSILAATATIVNNGSTSQYVHIARTSRNMVSGHSTYFCWVACYSPLTNVSPDSVLLAPGASTSLFVGDVLP